MVIPFELMYRLRFTPWELRPVIPAWRRITDGPDALPPGRALDVGCGTGRDACYLAGRGWQVTGVDIVAAAIGRARRRAAASGVRCAGSWGTSRRWAGLAWNQGTRCSTRLAASSGCPARAARARQRG